jgi:hypothetical protein
VAKTSKTRKATSIDYAADTVTPRQEAAGFMESGITGLIAAFNLADGRPWEFPTETREQAKAMLYELYALYHHGGFKPRTGPVLEGDAHFQKFMQQAIGQH